MNPLAQRPKNGGPPSPARRRWLGAVAGAPLAGPVADAAAAAAAARSDDPLVVHTFGDSILDCGHCNAHGVHPGGLLVRNDDRLLPEFAGRDLSSRGPAALVHRACAPSRLRSPRATVGGSTCTRISFAASGRGSRASSSRV